MTFSVAGHSGNDVLTLHVAGDLDLATADELGREIATATGGGAGEVVVDLAGVRFIDSAGINVLLKGRRLADERHLRYRVTNATGLVRHVLELGGVWTHLTEPAR
ncbi:STAS domain-containing protein [Dactylosporangium roseum]|uniref:Anti-sigma factor antagonist n=1 Tax=Dactylosporangium roseum TaxID=47989 RepID=A0ABY5YW75_9ACTN|nr:STAS domain-containing protein [Dactylosporangium roseum]UWZ33998.1 STAS domain-containing protein [Dactylosporangium roseum]